ncbi:choice-of-anchor J domain-containing protein, partial [candidate division WOR-3 bacterium]|nr:choice-of-anchor J domain-containing protein [candidate division WOR-3 bacterium]
HLNPPNLIIAARMNQAPSTNIDWTAWVFVKENTYSDLPSFVPIPTPDQLPDSVKKWLDTTDCAQINAPIVQQIADSIRDTTTNLIQLADDICNFCNQIPWQFPHLPYAFDAVYALTWGNSCTGHAHAGAALFRANGVPARTLLVIPTWYSGYLDMHWDIDYYVPDYEWVRMETSLGNHPWYPQNEVVTFACNPEDEFPLFFPCGIDGCWHTSDPTLGMWNPDWGGAHRAFNILFIPDSTDTIELAHSLTDSVFFYYSHYWGISLTPVQQTTFQTALDYQTTALANLQASNLDAYIVNMEQALNNYRNVNPEPITTIFFDDFENGQGEWTHGGTFDEWELGTPTYGPAQTYSGENCWGMDLDNTYENNADCWLKSPQIDLIDYSCAYLSFWVWNWVEDVYDYVYDPLWLDITTDGITFYPLCSKMGGVNDDPEIPDVGGWSMVALDLTKYLGNTVQIRFRFKSDTYIVQPGSYIDDVHVYGRHASTGIIAHKSRARTKTILLENSPNPFSNWTSISYELNMDAYVRLMIYNCSGQLINTLIDAQQKCGFHRTLWNSQDSRGKKVPAGIYFLQMSVCPESGDSINITKKMIMLK